MLTSSLNQFRGKRILLLQGPVGPFFWRFAKDLEQAGAQVFKVNFNGGDWLFYPSNAFSFCGGMEEWSAYLEVLLDRLNVDAVLLFGDCRPVHRLAHEVALRRGLEIGVFEEGYTRPNHITLERFGANGNSLIPRNPIFYLNNPMPPVEQPQQVGSTFWFAMLWAMLYYFAAGLLKPLFPHYRHHRPLSWLEGLPWLRSLWRKGYYAFKERGVSARLTGKLAGRFFLVPLQVHNDAQIHTHSGFNSVAQFIDEAMTSFAAHAPKNTALVIKHHPMDRGYCDYTKFIAERIVRLGLEDRCFYIHDQHLPTLLKLACGVVVVNSTVGLSALFHGAPVKVCGSAIYDMKGLTFGGLLADFWQEAQHARPDRHLFECFQSYLLRYTQLNGSFYKRLPIVASAMGIHWAAAGCRPATGRPIAAPAPAMVGHHVLPQPGPAPEFIVSGAP
ncbi:MAG: capsular biosynthesis protein [Gallionellales bacterium RIFCSPLOWO2_12_FULL_59_22]|nr:MAG: capsular biosynthesis protein [Gallionellales bacterium RIFCSPLOWO2_02_FULL_59_110]OGT02434.1 MAG: capsular biosynthesis protein [Gallionellales bacterium RIFCSPLOWO2_02_58_13]OGT13454.1 MAG: capsular biosynthesis protein [Gallionellales bacterium RIFCSPLOWO2_12_FULL_59_22]